MRDRFKFRGMNKGKWYFGAYFKHLSYTPYPIYDSESFEKDYRHVIIQDGFSDWGLPRNMVFIDVAPDTVGQCTGLKDKNGKLIYEGDIVEIQYLGAQISLFKNEYSKQPENERFEVFCHEDLLKFYAKNDHYRKTCEIHSFDLEKIRINTDNKIYKVIGNIYENPELLDVKCQN